MNKLLINTVLAVSLSIASASAWSNAVVGGTNSLGVYDISIDTTSLAGTSASLAFDFLGNSPGFANFVVISNLQTDGSLNPDDASSFGNVAIASDNSATLDSGAEFSEFFQPLILGNLINFRLDARNDPGAVLPGSTDFHNFFTVTLLDGDGINSLVSTTDPLGDDALLQLGFSVETPQSVDLAVYSASGITITATPVSAVPLPATLPLMGIAVSMLAGLQRRKALAV